ncbi:hypothetical protein ABT174_36855 [Streptomyces sparsogenes]|uniref:hypothetical protein n=1 Tax=Streptomyces sparsogenes TaxID=67365 RepID=UPI0033313BB7
MGTPNWPGSQRRPTTPTGSWPRRPPSRSPKNLRQISGDEVLARHEPEVALKLLLDHCGRSTRRWEALAAAMTFDYDEEKITFGQLLESLDPAAAGAQTS